jgi:hypothetical protein
MDFFVSAADPNKLMRLLTYESLSRIVDNRLPVHNCISLLNKHLA